MSRDQPYHLPQIYGTILQPHQNKAVNNGKHHWQQDLNGFWKLFLTCKKLLALSVTDIMLSLSNGSQETSNCGKNISDTHHFLTSGLHVVQGTSYCGHCNMQMCHSGVDTVRNYWAPQESARYQNDNCLRLIVPILQSRSAEKDCAQSFWWYDIVPFTGW